MHQGRVQIAFGSAASLNLAENTMSPDPFNSHIARDLLRAVCSPNPLIC